MNKHSYPFSDLNVWLSKAEGVDIFLPEKPSLDQVAASCALASSLNKSGKRAQVISPQLMKVEFNSVYGVNKVAHKIEGRSLVVEIDYPLENVEKISWDDRQPKVRLMVQPKVGAPAIEEKMVSFSREGGRVEKAILFGIPSLDAWKSLVSQLGAAETSGAELVSINIDQETNFAQIPLVDTNASSYCEVVAALAEGLSLPMGEDEANNLLLGLQAATNFFTADNVGPDAFEAAAFCLRLGGKLKKKEENGRFAPPKIYRGSSLM